MRRTPLRRRSKKAVAAHAQYKAACRFVQQRSGGLCEAGDFPHRCQGMGMEFHHVKRRSQGGANTPENLRHLCSVAHRVVHANPEIAAQYGLLRLREWT